jgi:hypothetical protein
MLPTLSYTHPSIHHQFVDNNFQFAGNNFQFVGNNFQFAVNKHCCSSPLQKLNFEAGFKRLQVGIHQFEPAFKHLLGTYLTTGFVQDVCYYIT